MTYKLKEENSREGKKVRDPIIHTLRNPIKNTELEAII